MTMDEYQIKHLIDEFIDEKVQPLVRRLDRITAMQNEQLKMLNEIGYLPSEKLMDESCDGDSRDTQALHEAQAKIWGYGYYGPAAKKQQNASDESSEEADKLAADQAEIWGY
jgi:hypothetical protein